MTWCLKLRTPPPPPVHLTALPAPGSGASGGGGTERGASGNQGSGMERGASGAQTSGGEVSRPMPVNLAEMSAQLARMSQLAIDVENLKSRNAVLEAELYKARQVRPPSGFTAPQHFMYVCAQHAKGLAGRQRRSMQAFAHHQGEGLTAARPLLPCVSKPLTGNSQ